MPQNAIGLGIEFGQLLVCAQKSTFLKKYEDEDCSYDSEVCEIKIGEGATAFVAMFQKLEKNDGPVYLSTFVPCGCVVYPIVRPTGLKCVLRIVIRANSINEAAVALIKNAPHLAPDSKVRQRVVFFFSSPSFSRLAFFFSSPSFFVSPVLFFLRPSGLLILWPLALQVTLIPNHCIDITIPTLTSRSDLADAKPEHHKEVRILQLIPI